MTEQSTDAGLKRTGGCLCRSVRFTIEAQTPRKQTLRPLIACHCKPCRKTSGSFVVATKVATKYLSFQNQNGNQDGSQSGNQETLVWYRSSDTAERGFCSRCGSSLFFRRKETNGQTDEETWSIMVGCLDKSHDLPFVGHIFAAEAQPMLAHLSETPQCKGWAEPSLVKALNKEGWVDTITLQQQSSS